MDLVGTSFGQPLSPRDIIAEFSRKYPAVAAAFAPLDDYDVASEIRSAAEGYLASFLIGNARLPAYSRSAAREIVKHAAAPNKVMAGELLQFPDELEPALNDILLKIHENEPRGSKVKLLSLYCLALLARLYRLEAGHGRELLASA